MSIYDHRDKPAYYHLANPDYCKNPHILKWWSAAHDSPHFPSTRLLRRFAPVPYQIGRFGG